MCTDMTWWPAGAIDGSVTEGKATSRYGASRDLAVLRGVEGALEVVDAGADVHAAAFRAAASPVTPRNAGSARKREVQLGDRPDRAVVTDPGQKIRLQIDGVDQSQERAPRIRS